MTEEEIEMARQEELRQDAMMEERHQQDCRDVWEAHEIPKERVRLHTIFETYPTSMRSTYWFGLVKWAWKENLGS